MKVPVKVLPETALTAITVPELSSLNFVNIHCDAPGMSSILKLSVPTFRMKWSSAVSETVACVKFGSLSCKSAGHATPGTGDQVML